MLKLNHITSAVLTALSLLVVSGLALADAPPPVPSGSGCYILRSPIAGITGPAVPCPTTTTPATSGDIRTESTAVATLLTTIPNAQLSDNMAVMSSTASGVYVSLDNESAGHPMLVEVSSGTAKDVLDLPARYTFTGISTGGTGLPVAAYTGYYDANFYFVNNGVTTTGVNIASSTTFPVITSSGLLALGNAVTPVNGASYGASCALVNIATGAYNSGMPCDWYNTSVTESASGTLYAVGDDGILYQAKPSAYLGLTGVIGMGGYPYTASWGGVSNVVMAVDGNDAFLYFIGDGGDIYRADLSQGTLVPVKIVTAPIPMSNSYPSMGLVWQTGGTAGGQLYEVGYSDAAEGNPPSTVVVYQIK